MTFNSSSGKAIISETHRCFSEIKRLVEIS
jgi:hypothetical protein